MYRSNRHLDTVASLYMQTGDYDKYITIPTAHSIDAILQAKRLLQTLSWTSTLGVDEKLYWADWEKQLYHLLYVPEIEYKRFAPNDYAGCKINVLVSMRLQYWWDPHSSTPPNTPSPLPTQSCK